MLLLLFTMLPFTTSLQSCAGDICWFAYQNSSEYRGVGSAYNINIPSNRTVTGIVTISGELFYPGHGSNDFLRFLANKRRIKPLYFEFDKYGNINIYGKCNYPIEYVKKSNYIRITNAFPNSTINIQISDRNIRTDENYTIYAGPPGQAKLVKYNYRSKEYWSNCSQFRLNTTTLIQNKFQITFFRFISICQHPKPILCDEESSETKNIKLGNTYTMSCKASGAPYLIVNWTKDIFGENRLTHKTTFDVSGASHTIQSTATITSFLVNDAGSYTCKIYNANFKKYVSKVFNLSAFEVISKPKVDHYTAGEGDVEFIWKISGWPLERVRLECNSDSGMNMPGDINKDLTLNSYNNNSTSLINYKTLKLLIQNGTYINIIACTVKDGTKLLDNMNIIRVGSSCDAGHRGDKTDCILCPPGYTSSKGSNHCGKTTNTCRDGEYGISSDCKVCPVGEISNNSNHLNQYAVKVEDCEAANSSCMAGDFGYNGNCTKCPVGQISQSRATKSSECYKVESVCKSGEYGNNNLCKICPDGKTSSPASVKLQDCEMVNSECTAGSYGRYNICTICPVGMISKPSTVKIQECYSKPKSNTTIIAGLTSGVIITVLFGVILFYSISTARKKRAKVGVSEVVSEEVMKNIPHSSKVKSNQKSAINLTMNLDINTELSVPIFSDLNNIVDCADVTPSTDRYEGMIVSIINSSGNKEGKISVVHQNDDMTYAQLFQYLPDNANDTTEEEPTYTRLNTETTKARKSPKQLKSGTVEHLHSNTDGNVVYEGLSLNVQQSEILLEENENVIYSVVNKDKRALSNFMSKRSTAVKEQKSVNYANIDMEPIEPSSSDIKEFGTNVTSNYNQNEGMIVSVINSSGNKEGKISAMHQNDDMTYAQLFQYIPDNANDTTEEEQTYTRLNTETTKARKSPKQSNSGIVEPMYPGMDG